jgi:trigger factor
MKLEYNLISGEQFSKNYEVLVFAQEINDKVDKMIVKFQKNFSMPGFRPGKVPLEVVRQKKMNEVLGEVLDEAINDSSFHLFNLEKIKPSNQPKVEISQFEPGKDLKYKLSVEILPSIPTVDFSSITLTKYVPEISEDEIEKTLKDLSQGYKDYNLVERQSKKGDKVNINFTGYVDDVAFEGGKAEDFELVLGSKSFIDNFEQQLEGKQSGDSVEVNVTFPANYRPSLANKKAKFDVAVNSVYEPEDVKIDEAFADKLGYHDLATLKEDIKKRLSFEFNIALRNITKKDLFDKLQESLDSVEVPQKMIDSEYKAISKQVLDAKKNEEDFEITKALEEKIKEIAKRRVVLGLFLAEEGERNAVTVSNEELSNLVRTQAESYGGEEGRRIVQYYRDNPRMLQMMRGPILEEKVVDIILEKINLDEQPKSTEEIRQIISQKAKEADEELGVGE